MDEMKIKKKTIINSKSKIQIINTRMIMKVSVF